MVRVGTWNIEGRWSPDHQRFAAALECDVWLLTEVREDTALTGFENHFTSSSMGSRKRWAGVFSRGRLQPLPDPHPASAAAVSLGLTWCSTILPWRSCGTRPWGDGTSSCKTRRALDQLMAALPSSGLVWGGDWNHALQGTEYAGSLSGRTAIEVALEGRRLTLATRELPHRIPGLYSIDHLAVPRESRVQNAVRIIAQDQRGHRLSDHDAYVMDFTTA